MSLDAHAEVQKLARELDVPETAIDGVGVLPADDVRRLRHLVADALHDAHRPAFQRAASASALLPTPLTARLAETLIGPYLAARIAAEMPPERSVRLASHLSVGFLADVCHSLDPTRVADTVRGLPDSTVVAVGVELLDRHEHVTLGRFVDVVREPVLEAMAARIDDHRALFEIAVSVEARHRLDDLVALLTDDQLDGLVLAAIELESLVAALALIIHLGAAGQARVLERVALAGEEVLEDIIRVADREDAWPEVFPLVASLDDEQLAAIAELDHLLTPDLLARLVSVGLDHQELWPDLVRTVERLPEERQVAVAERIAAMPGVSVTGLLALARTVPGATDLPGFRVLAEREA